MASKVVRVKDGQDVVSVFVYELKSSVILAPDVAFDRNHPVVKQAPWAFDLGDVEDASAEPGKKRSVSKPS